MAILAFQKPDKVIMLEGTETVGRFEFRPLEPGYGQTIGNALRRILLASLEGFAISQIKVGGVQEEFQTIPGVIEGMQDIILNLKQVRFRRMVDTVDTETASITISGKSEFTAEDISKGLSSFKVLNPELHICSLEPSVKLEITLTITKGRGFVPAEEMRDENTPIGTIPVDAIYTPIKKVNWTVENLDGGELPRRAEDRLRETPPGDRHRRFHLPGGRPSGCRQHPHLPLQAVHGRQEDLPGERRGVRQQGAGRGVAADAPPAADQALRHGSERPRLMKFRNFGRKSLNEIDLLVEKMKLSFGMDVTKYNIEPKKKIV